MVDGQEVLYRRVRLGWTKFIDGQWKVSSEAFNDQEWRPSVDRKLLREQPEHCKVDKSDGVVQLVAQEVRSVATIVQNPAAAAADQLPYRLDVIARPILAGNEDNLPENPAHAQIECDPAVATRSRFDKVKEALGRLAMTRNWVIEPSHPEEN